MRGAVVTIEQAHRYPSHVKLLLEVAAAIAVIVALALLLYDLARLFFEVLGTSTLMTLFPQFPQVRDWIMYVAVRPWPCCSDPLPKLPALLPHLVLFALALFGALLLRFGLPTVRTSARGVLVEFAGGWLPIPWESIVTIKVTEAGEKFVLLIQTDGKHLTGWHRFYSLLYSLSFRPGFLVTSAISDFDGLAKTLLSEADRVARLLDKRGAKLQEEASSPFFRLLLSPGDFFSQKAAPAGQTGARQGSATSVRDDVITGAYPQRITGLLRGVSVVLQVLVVVRVLVLVLTGLGLLIPGFGGLLSSFLNLTIYGPAWWPLVAALLVFVIGWPIAGAVGQLLPEVAARRDGFAVRYGGRWRVIPWASLDSVKVTELSETSQLVIVQARGPLPFAARLSSLLYDGSLRPGVIVTSALHNFEPLLQRAILEVMGGPTTESRAGEKQIFQSNAKSGLLMTLFAPNQALDQMVEDAREDSETLQLNERRILGAAKPMFFLSILPGLLVLFNRMFEQVGILDGRIIAAALMLILFGLLELPIVAFAANSVDSSTGGGEEGARPWYLYGLSQLPRGAALSAALLLMVVGVPYLPMLLWLGMLVWAFVLAAGLWGALYDWRGGLLLGGGLIPVFFQLVILIIYLLLVR